MDLKNGLIHHRFKDEDENRFADFCSRRTPFAGETLVKPVSIIQCHLLFFLQQRSGSSSFLR